MIKKRLNNKGFSLIELLVTIVILGILAAVGSVSYINYLEKSQEKAKEAFVKQIEHGIEDYISMYGSKELNFSEYEGTKEKCYTEVNATEENAGTEVCDEVDFYSASNNPTIEKIVTDVSDKDFINPVTEIQCTNDNLDIKVYRDSDYVYCFKIKPNGTESCIDKPVDSEYTIDTCEGLYK